MKFPRFGVRELVMSWIAYWVALAVVVFGPTVWRWYTLQHANRHGSVSWSYSGSLLTAALWVAGPPLLLMLLWLATGARRSEAGEARGSERARALR
jgi:hypothetical protein